MKFSIGHILIKTNNFREAVNDFEKLGFTVTYGGRPEKATNALIYFKDGTFLEIYDAKMSKNADKLVPHILNIVAMFDKTRADRYRNYTSSKEGFNEYAIDSVPKSDYGKNMEELKKTGLNLSKNHTMKRKDIHGNLLNWSVTFPSDWHLPFFMSSYSPDIKKRNNEISHKNGTQGIVKLLIGVDNLPHYERQYSKIFGNGIHQEDTIVYSLENQEICLKKNDSYQILGVWIKGAKEEKLDLQLTHSANIFIVV